MNLREVLDKIKSKLGADTPEELKSLIADAKRQSDDVIDALDEAKKEAKSRRLANRDLQSKVDEMDTKLSESSNHTKTIDDLKKKLSETEAMVSSFKTEKIQTLKEEFTPIFNYLTVDETSKHYDQARKLKKLFDIGDNFDDLSMEQLSKNIEVSKTLRVANPNIFNDGNPYVDSKRPYNHNEPPKSVGQLESQWEKFNE